MTSDGVKTCPNTGWLIGRPPAGRTHGLIYNGRGFIVGDAELPSRIERVGAEVHCRLWDAWERDDLWMAVGAKHERLTLLDADHGG